MTVQGKNIINQNAYIFRMNTIFKKLLQFSMLGGRCCHRFLSFSQPDCHSYQFLPRHLLIELPRSFLWDKSTGREDKDERQCEEAASHWNSGGRISSSLISHGNKKGRTIDKKWSPPCSVVLRTFEYNNQVRPDAQCGHWVRTRFRVILCSNSIIITGYVQQSQRAP